MRIAAVILAAGESARLGEVKQVAVLDGKTLLNYAITSAQEAGCFPIVAVVGANAEAVRTTAAEGAEVVLNEGWKLGLGTSIRAGIAHLLESHSEIEAVILMACDQPLVRQESLRRLVEMQRSSGKEIVAASYSETLGIPVLFLLAQFEKLLALADREGAKQIMRSFPDEVAKVPLPEAAEDIDTPAQLARLRNGIQQSR